MTTLGEGDASRRPAWRRALDRLGPLSPFATLETYSPAARRLLAGAEQDVERLLHVVRLVVVAVASGFAFFGFGLIGLPVRFVVPSFVGLGLFGVLWLAVWRRLGRGLPGLGLRCAMIAFDAYLIDRGVLLFQNPGGIVGRIDPEMYRALAGGSIAAADVEAATPPMLVLLAITGALRLDPRLAAFSTAMALAVYAHFRVVFPAPPNRTWVVAIVIYFAGVLGANAARAFRWMTLKASHERLLEPYVPAALTQEILRSGDPDRVARVETVSVLVADVRGFTRLAESLGPAGAVALLNDWFGLLGGPLARESAVIDKYLGDGLLAFFEGPDHAARALRAARDVLESLALSNRDRAEPLRIGIAIHAGDGLLGTIGAGGRRDYTLIGDVVNVAARLEDLNKELESSLVVSTDALDLVPPDAADDLVGPRTVEVRGRAAGIRVRYLPSALDPPASISARTRR